MLETKFVRDNYGKGHHVYTGLKKGEKVDAIVNQRGRCDSGNIHLLFDGSILTKGKVYAVTNVQNWGFTEVPVVTDDDGCCQWVDSERFKLL